MKGRGKWCKKEKGETGKKEKSERKVPDGGLEPPTLGLTVPCASHCATQAPPHLLSLPPLFTPYFFFFSSAASLPLPYFSRSPSLTLNLGLIFASDDLGGPQWDPSINLAVSISFY